MKHLYIIGNGFDIFTGLHTKYSDFKLWLKHNYPFVYENLRDTYNMDGDWWNDFEHQLGQLDVKRFIDKFTPPPKERINEIRQMCSGQTYNHVDLYSESLCAGRLRGLFDTLQYCFEKWITDCQRLFLSPQHTNINKEDSYFITFNYTDTLEILYGIPEDRVLHIHGRASKHEHLVFGHDNGLFFDDIDSTSDWGQTITELLHYEKNPYEFIYKNKELPAIIKDVTFIHILGFSFSTVDEDYLDWIYSNTPITCNWEISWHSSKDEENINKFIDSHPFLRERVTLFQLQPI